VYWYLTELAEEKVSGPVDCTLTIYNERAEYLILSLKQCDERYGPKFHWINEKLLYVRVWWGRIVGTDIIVDVESSRIVYQEDVHDGVIPYQQWHQQGTN
jgi:hypothetical protein